jgi:hypothetical protein
MFIWFPYKIPGPSSFKGSLSDFEHLSLSGSEHGYSLDSIPVGIPQTAGTPESLHIPQKIKTYHLIKHNESENVLAMVQAYTFKSPNNRFNYAEQANFPSQFSSYLVMSVPSHFAIAVMAFSSVSLTRPIPAAPLPEAFAITPPK